MHNKNSSSIWVTTVHNQEEFLMNSPVTVCIATTFVYALNVKKKSQWLTRVLQ